MRESGGVKILMYHWISGDPGQRLRHWGVTPDQFEGQMRHLHEQGYRTLRLSEVAQAVQGLRPLSERTVALTFDDGYRDFLHFAAPILEEYGFTATVFLVADRVGEINAWDERHGDPPRPLLSWEEAAELATRGFEMGSHARTHRALPRLSDRELAEEIAGSKAILEDRLGIPVAHFSYPHGLFDDRCRKLVSAAGYQSACADIRGGNRAGTDPYQLRRSLMTCHETAWSFAFKLRTGFGMREWLALEMGELRGRPAPALLGGTS